MLPEGSMVTKRRSRRSARPSRAQAPAAAAPARSRASSGKLSGSLNSRRMRTKSSCRGAGAAGARRMYLRGMVVVSPGRSDARLDRLAADPRHHVAQPLPDPLDLMVGVLGPQPLEVGPPGLLLGHHLAGELAVLDVGQQLAHVLAHVLVDHARAACEVA